MLNDFFLLYLEQIVLCLDALLQVLTSIPGIDSHDANAVCADILCVLYNLLVSFIISYCICGNFVFCL
jgi:hypothetical protein